MFQLWIFLLCFSCIDASADRALPEIELPAAWFWGNVEGMSFLTRVQSEHTPKCASHDAFPREDGRLRQLLSSELGTVDGVGSVRPVENLERRHASSSVPFAPSLAQLHCYVQLFCECFADDVPVPSVFVHEGGDPLDALEYISHVGVPDDTCQNYEGKEGICDSMGICRDCAAGNVSAGQDMIRDGHCLAVDDFQLYGLETYGNLKRDAELEKMHPMIERMKQEIYTNGPITCSIRPSQEFIDYVDGTISSSPASTEEVHFINLVGWDATKKMKYWIGRNCWGEAWGNGGFVQIEMGVNALGIESNCFWGIPTLHRPNQNRGYDDDEEDRGLYRVKRSRLAAAPPCRCVSDAVEILPPPRLSRSHLANADIPDSYDIRNIDGRNYAVVDKNQHIPAYCGSCWAFAAVSALADRYALLYAEDAPLFDLATQVVINCAEGARGCRGGYPDVAYEYTQMHGLPHESCAPYQAVDQECISINVCKSCQNDTCAALPEDSFRHFGVVDYGVFIGEENMKKEIWSGGPIACLLSYTSELHAYAGGILNDTTGKRSFDHVLEVAGWGTENGIDYWIVRNSWGTYWGEDGWGRIAVGPGDLGLSSLWCSWATPKPFDTPLPYQTFLRRQMTT